MVSNDGFFKKEILKKMTRRYPIGNVGHMCSLFFFFGRALHSLWNLSTLTRNRTYTPCSGSMDF